MLFNSYIFIFAFLPIAVAGYFLLQKISSNTAKIFLSGMSLFFYAYFEYKYLLLIGASLIFNSIMGKQLIKTKVPKVRKALLAIGLSFNISILLYFKYMDFFISNINILTGNNFTLLHLILPLGISFITFQKIAFLVDCYKGTLKEFKIIDFCLFVTFFPQLIAGPIVHHNEVFPQFNDESKRKMIIENVSKGLYIFSIGLSKKVIIADTFAQWANYGYNNIQALSTIDAWITTLSYTFQLYFDFSGYCDMAIGAALLFNIKLPVNFFSPYKSKSIQEFWRHWHMTLGRFFTNYIYFPLGGSKNGRLRTYRNVFIVFFVSGFWHGAGWTFVIWGIMHGIASIINRIYKDLKLKMPSILGWMLTMGFVHFAWIFFRAQTVNDAVFLIKRMFHPDYLYLSEKYQQIIPETLNSTSAFANITYLVVNILPFEVESSQFNFQTIVYVLIGFVIVLFTKNSIEKMDSIKYNKTFAFSAAVMFILSIMYLNRVSTFLYFNF